MSKRRRPHEGREVSRDEVLTPSGRRLPEEWERNNWLFMLRLRRRGPWWAKLLVAAILLTLVTAIGYEFVSGLRSEALPAIVVAAAILAAVLVVSWFFTTRDGDG